MKKYLVALVLVVMMFTSSVAMAACYLTCVNTTDWYLRFQVDNSNVSTGIDPGGYAYGYVSNDIHTLYAYYHGRLVASRTVDLTYFSSFKWTIVPY